MKLRHIAFANDDWYYCKEFRELIERAVGVANFARCRLHWSGDYHDYADVLDEFQRNWCEQVRTLWIALGTLNRRLEFPTLATGSGGAIELVQEYQQSVGIGAIYAGHNQKISRLCDDALDAAIEQTLDYAIKVVERLAGLGKLLHIAFANDDWYYCKEFRELIERAACAAGESVSGDYHDYSDVLDEFQRNWCEQVYTLWTATGRGGAIELVQIYQQSIGIGAIYAGHDEEMARRYQWIAGHDEEMARLCDAALDAAIESTVGYAIRIVKHLAEQAEFDKEFHGGRRGIDGDRDQPKNPREETE